MLERSLFLQLKQHTMFSPLGILFVPYKPFSMPGYSVCVRVQTLIMFFSASQTDTAVPNYLSSVQDHLSFVLHQMIGIKEQFTALITASLVQFQALHTHKSGNSSIYSWSSAFPVGLFHYLSLSMFIFVRFATRYLIQF